MAIKGLGIVGERINPGFRSARQAIENEDFEAIQALAVRQAVAGVAYLNVNAGRRSKDDPDFMVDVIRAIQQVVDIPLSFDYPDAAVQEVCLKAYDIEKAKGRIPVINSITETRWEMADLLRIRPAKVIVMASERQHDGMASRNKTSDDICATAKRLVKRLQDEYDMKADDIIVDISIGTLAADTEGLVAAALDAVGRIGSAHDMRGVHMIGGLSNIAQQLPLREVNGIGLSTSIECAFLTRAMPRGLDMILGTPWKDYYLMEEDEPLLQAFDDILRLRGREALRRMRALYTNTEQIPGG